MTGREDNTVDYGVISLDARGEITYMDSGAGQLLQISPAKTPGHKFAEVFPGTRVLEVFTTGQAVTQEQTLTGARVHIHYFPVFKGNGLETVFVYLRKIGPDSGQKSEETLQVLNRLYEGILAELPLGLAVVDQQARIVMINALYCQILGVAPEHLVGLPIQEAVPFSQLRKVLSSGVGFVGTGICYRNETLFLSEVPIKQGRATLGGLSKVLTKESLAELNTRELLERFQLLEGRMLFYKEELREIRCSQSPFENLIGETPEMQKLKQCAQRIARGDANVLITGESGTGKGVLAQAIHDASRRNAEPFIKINCAAIPENLLEAELFGYEEGAFTGAVRGGRPGKFELAQGGTIFLDEIGDMPLSMQVKILRVLQEKSFERIGGAKTLTVSVRILAATNRDLPKLIESGKFRLDLYYRLAVISLHIPALRQRRGDILPLTRLMMNRLNLKYGLEVRELAPEVVSYFLAYQWPGNVRELENALEYAFNFFDEGEKMILFDHLPPALLGRPNPECGLELNEIVAQAETEAIRQALQLAKGNKQEAARLLGIHPSGLYQKLKKYAIEN